MSESFPHRSFPKPVEVSREKYTQITLRFPKEMAYRVYDEFDKTQIEYLENSDLIASAKMPVDAWLIGYLLSFGEKVEIIEPKYLCEILAAQAYAVYEKNKP